MGEHMDFKSIFEKLIVVVLVVAVLFAGYNVMQSFGQTPSASPTPSVTISTVTPTPTVTLPKISLSVISVPECDDCFNMDALLFWLEQNGADLDYNVYAYNEAKGAELIEQYGIKKVPTLIASGEISNLPEFDELLQQAADKVDGKFVLRDISPPYLDIEKDEIVGRVSITMVYDQDCFSCRSATIPISAAVVNASLLGEALVELWGIPVDKDMEYEANTSEAQELIEKYSLTRLPAIILSDDISLYEDFAAAFERIGTIEDDGNYVLRELNPPYLNLSSGEEEGMLTIIYLKAGEYCDPECYDYLVHESALARLGVIASTSLYFDFDSPSGKNLTEKYNITRIPTVLISPDVKDYAAFMFVNDQLGEFEDDGWFIFRNFEVLEGASYFDITQNKTILVEPSAGVG